MFEYFVSVTVVRSSIQENAVTSIAAVASVGTEASATSIPAVSRPASESASHRDDTMLNLILNFLKPCQVGSVGSVSASRTVGREFASRPGYTKDHYKNGTNCLPA